MGSRRRSGMPCHPWCSLCGWPAPATLCLSSTSPSIRTGTDEGGLCGACNQPMHRRAAIDDVAELRGLVTRARAQLFQLLVGDAKDVRDKFRRERNVEWDPMRPPLLLRRLNELCAVTRLAEDQPDCSHRRRSGAEVEGQLWLLFKLPKVVIQVGRDSAIDLVKICRARQFHVRYLRSTRPLAAAFVRNQPSYFRRSFGS